MRHAGERKEKSDLLCEHGILDYEPLDLADKPNYLLNIDSSIFIF